MSLSREWPSRQKASATITLPQYRSAIATYTVITKMALPTIEKKYRRQLEEQRRHTKEYAVIGYIAIGGMSNTDHMVINESATYWATQFVISFVTNHHIRWSSESVGWITDVNSIGWGHLPSTHGFIMLLNNS